MASALCIFFFSSRRRHTRFDCDWSSDVCSSDLRLSAEQLRAIEDDAVRAVVQMQRDVGLQSATDGEFRRASWHMDFIYQLGGIEKAPGDIKVQFHNEQGDIEFTPAAIHVAEKVHLDHTI